MCWILNREVVGCTNPRNIVDNAAPAFVEEIECNQPVGCRRSFAGKLFTKRRAGAHQAILHLIGCQRWFGVEQQRHCAGGHRRRHRRARHAKVVLAVFTAEHVRWVPNRQIRICTGKRCNDVCPWHHDFGFGEAVFGDAAYTVGRNRVIADGDGALILGGAHRDDKRIVGRRINNIVVVVVAVVPHRHHDSDAIEPKDFYRCAERIVAVRFGHRAVQ